jgi:hypothetical protein
MKATSILAGALVLCMNVCAQDVSEPVKVKQKKVHGTFYMTWGYHRDNYSNSTIHFKDKSEDYDFKIYHAKSCDRLDIHDNFIDGEPITVPQYVLYGGYFFGNKGDWGIEVGWDHLKYIVNDNQVLHLKGNIHGQYYDLDTLISPSFLHYEHTNGNNYLMASLLKRYKIYRSPKANHKLSAIVKLGGGALVPKTYSNMFGKVNDGPFRPSGIVVGTSLAARYDIFKYFFIENSVKGCFADYTGAKLYGEGRATHHFFSLQYIFSFGFNIPMTKNQ